MSREEGQINLDKCHTDRRWKAVRFGYKAEYPAQEPQEPVQEPSDPVDVPEEVEFADAPEEQEVTWGVGTDTEDTAEEPEFEDIQPTEDTDTDTDTAQEAVETPTQPSELPSQDDLLNGLDEDGNSIGEVMIEDDEPSEDTGTPAEPPQEVAEGTETPQDGEEPVEPVDTSEKPPEPVEKETMEDIVTQAHRYQDDMADGRDGLQSIEDSTEPIEGGTYDTLPSQESLLSDDPPKTDKKKKKDKKTRGKAKKTADTPAQAPQEGEDKDGTDAPKEDEQRPEWQDRPTQERRHKWMDWKKWPIISSIIEFRERMYDPYTWQDPFNTLGQIVRWRMTRRGYITLSRVWYDSTLRIYRWDDTLVKKKDVVKRNTPYLSLIDKERQVHVTGVPKTYFLFDSHLRRPRDEHENGFTAQAQYIYAMDNSFNEALAQTSRPKTKKSDWTPLIIAAVIGLSVIVYLLFFRH